MHARQFCWAWPLHFQIGRGCGLKFIDMPTHNKTSDCMVKTCNCMYTDNNPVVFNHEVEVFVH